MPLFRNQQRHVAKARKPVVSEDNWQPMKNAYNIKINAFRANPELLGKNASPYFLFAYFKRL